LALGGTDSPAVRYRPMDPAERDRRQEALKRRLPEWHIWLDEFGMAELASTVDPAISSWGQDRIGQFLRANPEIFGIEGDDQVSFEVEEKPLSEERLLAVQRFGELRCRAGTLDPYQLSADPHALARRAAIEVRRFLPLRLDTGMVRSGRLEIRGHHWPNARLPARPGFSEQAVRALFESRGASAGAIKVGLEPFFAWGPGKASLDLRLVYVVEIGQRRWLTDAMTGDGYAPNGQFVPPLAAPGASAVDGCGEEAEAAVVRGQNPKVFFIPWLGASRLARDDATFCLCQLRDQTCAHWRTWQGMWGCGAVTMRPRTCICDECATDGDCAAGTSGQCRAFPRGGPCGNPVAPRVCVYRGDPCHEPASCGSGNECQGGPKGHPVCAPVYRGPAPPSVAH